MNKYCSKKLIVSVCLFALILLISACSGSNNRGRESLVDNSGSIEYFYTLPDTEPGYKFKTPAFKGVLGIPPLDTDSLRGDRRMLFKLSARPLEIRLHHFRFWTDSPTKLVQQKISIYLRDIQFASKVIRFVPGTKVDYLMHASLIKFERLVNIKSSSDEVLVSIELSISKESTGQIVVPATIYHIRQKAVRARSANDTISNAVKSFKIALDKALLQFVQQHAAKQFSQRIKIKPTKKK
ncbi:hypothetical protein MNBD_GAMMA12-1516 [hydrothermal vent metagenome]|uniref:ABC-type transport auxiliary lipoprotein component domain-containing protein n=1 Tax=hydrothermal vent metagenome TaxID=652676 RepID=A0A3B0ZKR7_9ZZZZ